MKKRASILTGNTIKIKTGCGTLYVTINDDEEGNPIEVFIRLGKGGGCAAAQCESIGRLLSWGLRSGAGLETAMESLMGIRCSETNLSDNKYSCSDAVSKAIAKRLEIKSPTEQETIVEETKV